MNTESRQRALKAGRDAISGCFADTGKQPRKINIKPIEMARASVRNRLESGDIHPKKAQVMLRKITLRYSEFA